jgi:hypothetical protein
VTVLTTFATLRVALPAVELAVELALRAVEAALRMVEPALRAVEVALRTVLRAALRVPRRARFAGRFAAEARLAVALRRVVARRFVAARAAGFRAVLPRAGRRFAVRDAVRARAAVVRFTLFVALLRTALLLEAGFLLRLDPVLAMSFPPEVARIREPVAAKLQRLRLHPSRSPVKERSASFLVITLWQAAIGRKEVTRQRSRYISDASCPIAENHAGRERYARPGAGSRQGGPPPRTRRRGQGDYHACTPLDVVVFLKLDPIFRSTEMAPILKALESLGHEGLER